jgi:type IV secretory pathway TraG/TraD family ATPase VirD4
MDQLVVGLALLLITSGLYWRYRAQAVALLLTALVLLLTYRGWGIALSTLLGWALGGLSSGGVSASSRDRWALLVGPLLFALVWLKIFTRHATTMRVERGTRLADTARVDGVSARLSADGAPTLQLAGLPLARQDESRHFKFIGTTGTGKSTAIRSLLGQALARGDRAVIADPDFGFVGDFYQPACRDVLLSPFDGRTQRWDPYQELHTSADYDALASALVVSQQRSDLVWIHYARVLLAALLRRTSQAGLGQLSQLLQLVQAAGLPELRLLLQDTPAAAFVESGNERMFASIRAVCMSSLSPLAHLPAAGAAGFSVKAWVHSDSRVLFLPYRADQVASLRSLISTWMRLAIEATLARGEQDTPLWFVVDELDALGAIDGLKDALVRLRKYGGRCVLGFQSIGQLVGTYGEHDAKTIAENCANTLILRCAGSGPGGTARYAQDHIGERQVTRTQLSQTRPQRWWGRSERSQSSSQSRTIEPAVLAAEIEQLPDLTGYFKRASAPHWQRVTLALPTARRP